MKSLLLASMLFAQIPPVDNTEPFERPSGSATVILNGQRLPTMGLIWEDRVQVPMRIVFERLGAKVRYTHQNRTIVASTGEREVSLVVGENFAYMPEHTLLDYPPQVVDNRVYVPLRFVSEALGAKVDWNPETRIVNIQHTPARAR